MRATSQKKTVESGFTIFELVVVIAIFGIMSSIVLANFKNFGDNVSFDNLIQDVATRIIQAQKAAISGVYVPGTVVPAYGVFFDTVAPLSSAPYVDTYTHIDNQNFVYFADRNNDKFYNYGAGVGAGPSNCSSGVSSTNECLSTTLLPNGDYLSGISYMSISGSSLVYNATYSGTAIQIAHITFTRPFPDASMILFTGPLSSTQIPATDVFLEFTSGGTSPMKKTIIVTSLGQVRVYNGNKCSAADSVLPLSC